ncbi:MULTISPECIES: integrase arm-type DNA-binding domain-containing protein [Hyphomicrobiales]|uniref:tyrosine-type recombinase/integrase n=1 Tax=Hyphomicrobiales TaxID=356 RepID=UPI003265F169
MARQLNRLSPRKVATISKPGRHADGGGLYLVVGPGASRRWVFLFRREGKLNEMGLGGLSSVSLADARRKAEEARKTNSEGRNPIAERRAEEARREAAVTFGAFADDLVEDISHGFRNEKHKAQWAMTLKTYAAPIREKGLDQITTDDVLDILKPMWRTKSETASRLRGRIERVLDAAKAKGLREGENPARWRGHLANLLPKRQRLARGHHAAMPYADVPAFLDRLRAAEGVSPLALEFLILAAARSGEVLGARWEEVDREAQVWTVPADRMKGGREHRVPLTDRMVNILDAVEPIRTGDYVFPGQKPGRPLSVMALEMVLRRMKIEDATVHGFRSSFRDWAAEETSFPREVAEAALAHVVGDATERAYRRGDALEQRRRLMNAWADFGR